MGVKKEEEKSFLAAFVKKSFRRLQDLLFMRECILERSLINAVLVASALADSTVCRFMREYILERSLTNAIPVTSASADSTICRDMREFILERNPTNVSCVAGVSLRVETYVPTK